MIRVQNFFEILGKASEPQGARRGGRVQSYNKFSQVTICKNEKYMFAVQGMISVHGCGRDFFPNLVDLSSFYVLADYSEYLSPILYLARIIASIIFMSVHSARAHSSTSIKHPCRFRRFQLPTGT